MENRRSKQPAFAGPRKKTSSDEWYTPLEIIRALGTFDLDPACGPLCKNRTARRRIGPKQNGLKRKWTGRVWCNPPFSKCRAFVDKMIEHGDGIMLIFLPLKCRWFSRAITSAGGFFLFDPQPKFTRPSGSKAGVPNNCCLIPFGRRNRAAIQRAGLKGIWLDCE